MKFFNNTTLLIIGTVVSTTNASSCTHVGVGFCSADNSAFATTLEVLCDGDSNCTYTQRKCEKICKNTEGCTGYEHSPEYGSCLLKSSTLADTVVENEFHDCYSCPWQTTGTPTVSPTPKPTSSPTTSPTPSPTKQPSTSPTNSPSASPSTSPTKSPSVSPSASPTKSPSATPTALPTKRPTLHPTTNDYNMECRKIGDGFCMNESGNLVGDSTTLCDGDSNCFYTAAACERACAAEGCSGYEVNTRHGSCIIMFEFITEIEDNNYGAECFVCTNNSRRLRGN